VEGSFGAIRTLSFPFSWNTPRPHPEWLPTGLRGGLPPPVFGGNLRPNTFLRFVFFLFLCPFLFPLDLSPLIMCRSAFHPFVLFLGQAAYVPLFFFFFPPSGAIRAKFYPVPFPPPPPPPFVPWSPPPPPVFFCSPSYQIPSNPVFCVVPCSPLVVGWFPNHLPPPFRFKQTELFSLFLRGASCERLCIHPSQVFFVVKTTCTGACEFFFKDPPLFPEHCISLLPISPAPFLPP